MKIGSYYFIPSWFAILITTVAIALFSSLSVWQLQRAHYKDQLAQQIQEQNRLSVITIGKDEIVWPASRFRSAEVSGTYETEDQILLDNIIKSGKPGYHVITPFKINNSEQRLLINRGWTAAGNDRRVLPQIKVQTGELTLKGQLAKPQSKPVMFGTDYLPDFEGNQRWAYIDLDYMSQKFNYSLLPYTLLQTESTGEDGLSRKWAKYVNKSGMHIGYSIQWGAFALIAFISFIILNTKKRESHLDGK